MTFCSLDHLPINFGASYCSLGSIIFRECLVWNHSRHTGRNHDLSSCCFVLSHKVNSQLRTIHYTFVVHVGAQKIGLWRNPNLVSVECYITGSLWSLLIGSSIAKSEYRTGIVNIFILRSWTSYPRSTIPAFAHRASSRPNLVQTAWNISD